MHVRPKNDASNGVFFKGRGAQHAAETKNKSKRRGVSKNEERKEDRGKDKKEGNGLPKDPQARADALDKELEGYFVKGGMTDVGK